MALYPDIFNGVTAQLANYAAGVESNFGEEHISDAGAPPRITWVVGGDNFGASSSRTEAAGRSQVRSLATCETAVEAHIWAARASGTDTGGDYAAAQSLRDAFVTALRAYLGANFELQSGRWEGAQNVARGRKYVLSFAVRVPVVEVATLAAPPTTVVVTAENQTDAAFSH